MRDQLLDGISGKLIAQERNILEAVDTKLATQSEKLLNSMDDKLATQKEAIVKDVADYIADTVVPLIDKQDRRITNIENRLDTPHVD